MKRFEYDIAVHQASRFQQLVYFCTSDGVCSEEPAPAADFTAKLRELLNARGDEGWELIHLVFSPQGIVTFWKRETDRGEAHARR